MKKHFLLLSLTLGLGLASAQAQTIIALSAAGELIQIANANAPGTTGSPVSITGVAMGQTIVGIDYRPNTGELYALGYNSMMSAGNAQLYVLDATTGAATAIGTAVSLSLGSGGIGFDFNPTVDRIRIVGENGANYRLHPVTGAIAATDGMLAYNSTDPNTGMTPAIVACAYTNSYIGSEATTLFDYDKNLNILASQVPPNNGILNTIGSSGIMVASMGSNVGMDIYFDPITKTNRAYMNATVGGVNNLYSVNSGTGMATLIGTIGAGTTNIREIAVKIDRTVPATYAGQLLYGLTKVNRNLIKFSSSAPELIRELLPVTGLAAGHVLVGMDVRPLDRQLYALGYHDTSRAYQLYVINTTTGAATAVGSPGTINLGMGEKIGFDFNPTVDRIRVVSTNDSNFRLNPITGAIAATDTSLAYAATDINAAANPTVSSVAYTNSYKGATATMLIGLDDNLGAIAGIAPPNRGTLNTLAGSVLPFNAADVTNDMDFFYDSTAMADVGYLSANTGTSVNDVLYTCTAAGSVTMLDSIGLGVQLTDIAVQLTYTGPAPVVGLPGQSRLQGLHAYPVPVTNVLHISFSNPPTTKTTLRITGVGGNVVKIMEIEAGSSTLDVQVANLPAGLYIIGSAGNDDAIRFIKE